MLFTLVGLAFSIAALVCWLIVTVDAFKEALWKGVLCIFACGIYWLYYAFFEFEHDNKWPIVLVAIFGSGIAGTFFQMAR